MAKQLTKDFIATHSREEFLEYYRNHKVEDIIHHFELRTFDIYQAVKQAYNITEKPNQNNKKPKKEKSIKEKVAPNKGKVVYTDGNIVKYFNPEDTIPEGFAKGRPTKGYHTFYNEKLDKVVIAKEAPDVSYKVGGKRKTQDQIQKCINVKEKIIQEYSKQNNLIPLFGCIDDNKYPKCVVDKEFMNTIHVIKHKHINFISIEDLQKVKEYQSIPIDRYLKQKEFKEKFEKENNCTLLNDLILKYGQLKFLLEIEKIKTPYYKNLNFVDNKYLPEIENIYNNNLHGASYQEQSLIDYIKSIYKGNLIEHARIIPSDCSSYKREVDCYLPDLHLAIEYNGVYRHSDQCGIARNYHEQKSKECEKLGIRLIHIYSDEWLNDSNKIKSLLSIAINGVTSKIYARKCQIRQITNKEAKDFNNLNHLQNHRNAQVTYGLFYNDNLVQLMSFSKSKYNRNLKSNNAWEIIRGCPGSNNIVVGGVSKLFKHFVRDYNPDEIFSYCDFNKFDGTSYEALGMKFIGYTGPNKWWIYNNHRINRNPSRYKELKNTAQGTLWGAGSKKYLWRKEDENKENHIK